MRLLRAAVAAVFGSALVIATGAAAAGTTVAAPDAPGKSGGIPLTAPVRDVDPLNNPLIGLRKDRLLTSVVPGEVDDREEVTVGLGPGGTPTVVTDRQRLLIDGAGNYIIRELGPARAAVGLGGTVPPVLELGTVVWQGFSPGRRELSADLTLDAGIEAHRLPLVVSLSFADRSGHARPLSPAAAAPVDGTLTVTLVNQTGIPRDVAVGVAAPGAVATLLDRLRVAAARPSLASLPVAGAGLPRSIAGTLSGQSPTMVVAPLRVTGTVGVAGGGPVAVSGAGVTPTADGAQVAGTLTDRTSFRLDLRAGQRLALALQVQPWLDPRTLSPPAPARSWRQWATDGPGSASIQAATSLLVTSAAVAARAEEYSPYLQANTPGPDRATFRYVMAPPTQTRRAGEVLRAKPIAIVATVIAALAIAGNAALLRRRW